MSGFGIGASLSSYGARARSPSLAAFGQDEESQAMGEMGQAASLETQRNAENTRLAAQDKAGKQQLGATLGAMAGNAVLPGLGGVIGGLFGGLAGGLF